MNSQSSSISLTAYPSLIPSSIFSDGISIKSELPLSLANQEGTVNFALQSFSEINIDDLSLKSQDSLGKHHLELNKSTSFEQILMENHRTALIEAIRQYLQNINHEILLKVKNSKWSEPKLPIDEYPTQTIQSKQTFIQNILLANGKIDEVTCSKLVNRLSNNAQQVKIISEMLSICPKNIQFQVAYLLTFLLRECCDIIEHFKPKLLSKELKERSDKYADQLRAAPSLCYLFQGDSPKKIESCFRIMIEKWMITLFLMKVGVFQNELKSKSIQEYLKSEVFKTIDLNDLLNQHLIHPFRKVSKKA